MLKIFFGNLWFNLDIAKILLPCVFRGFQITKNHESSAKEAVDKQIVYDCYKDLGVVEQVFRTCKTEHLEVRPFYVRTEKSRRGHVSVVMLAYMIRRVLSRAWVEIDLTVEEGIKQLSTLCSREMKVKDQGFCLKIPRPRKKSQDLLKALNIHLPFILPHREDK